MSTHTRIRKRQQHCSQHTSPHKQHILPQLRLLALESKASPCRPGRHRLQPKHNNIRDEKDTEAPVANIEHPALKSASSGHGYTSSSILPPDPASPNVERKQSAAVCPKIRPNRVALTLANDDLPEAASRNLLAGAPAVTHEGLGLWTLHPPYGNIQHQEITQNRDGRDYWIPTLDAPEVAIRTATAQPTVGIHQSQCFLTRSEFLRKVKLTPC